MVAHGRDRRVAGDQGRQRLGPLSNIGPLDDDVLADLNCQEFSRFLIRTSGPQAVLHEQDGVLFCASNVTFPVLFNIAWRTDPILDAHRFVARTSEWFASKKRGWSVMVRDHAVDDDLRIAVEQAGLLSVLDAPAMVMDEPPEARSTPDGVELRWVTDEVGFDDFVAVNDVAYSASGLPLGTVRDGVMSLAPFMAPHVHSVVAYEDDRPVAAAQIVLSHSIAGVYWVGTIPDATGRGLGDLVSRAVTRRGFQLGANFVSLQASTSGESVYRQMGYVERYRYQTWAQLAP